MIKVVNLINNYLYGVFKGILYFFQLVGRLTIVFATKVGTITIFIASIFSRIINPPYYASIFIQQLLFIGFYSLTIVGITAISAGAALTLQSYYGFTKTLVSAGSNLPVAKVVTFSIIRELGPVLTALVVNARAGSTTAAEISTMRVTEQIDALFALATDSIRYLISPRVMATTISVPVLVIIADILGIFGAYIIAIYNLPFDSTDFLKDVWENIKTDDIICGLIKALVFGFIISITSCFKGYGYAKGASGVGAATRNAVSNAAILIIVADYIIMDLLS